MACYYQIFGEPKDMRQYGWGNCIICSEDEKNKDCKGHIKISVSYFEVRRQSDDQKTKENAEEK